MVPARPFFEGQARLGSVERPDLGFLIDAKHDGVRRQIDTEPDNVTQLAEELRVLGQFELPHAMRLEPVSTPDALNRGDADADGLGHRRAGPMGCLVQRRLQGQFDDALGHRGRKFRDAGGSRLVAQEPAYALGAKALLPVPDAGLGFASLAHDGVRAAALSAQQYDLRSPLMFLCCVAVFDERTKPIKVGRADGKDDAGSHGANSHGFCCKLRC
jgi:hypothetical protein